MIHEYIPRHMGTRNTCSQSTSRFRPTLQGGNFGLADGLDGASGGLAEAKDPQVADRCALATVAHHRHGQVVLGIGKAARATETEMAIAAG